jgi:hypothetical protein
MPTRQKKIDALVNNVDGWEMDAIIEYAKDRRRELLEKATDEVVDLEYSQEFESTLSRTELGSRLCEWHSSMNDPIYAVGSFYVSDNVYPDKGIVKNAIFALTSDLNQHKRMLNGERVMVIRSGKQVNLKKFAGYTDSQLKENIADLEEIVSELQRFMAEDYK